MKKVLLIILILSSVLFSQNRKNFIYYLAGGDDSAPFAFDMVVHLGGEIIDVEGSKYFVDRSGNNRNFLITNYDFDANWSGGFPYKSAATISAPAGDTILIQEDVNHFFYAAADSTPNQIPVVSLFQDIDYANKLFVRHGAQRLDANLVEVYAPRVLDIALYSNTKTGADLTVCQTYYGVPTEVLTAKWIDPVNGVDATGDGTKALPYKTFSKAISVTSSGGTIYCKTGSLDETCSIVNKGVSVMGTGFTKNNRTGAAAFLLSNNGTAQIIISGFILSNAPSIGVQDANSGVSNTTVQKCLIVSGNAIYGTSHVAGRTFYMQDCVVKGSITNAIDNLLLQGNLFQKPASGIIVQNTYNLTSKYNTYLGSATTIIRRYVTNTTSMSLFNDKLYGSIFTDENIATPITITINYCTLIGEAATSGASVSFANVNNQAVFVITNNTMIQTYTTASTFLNIKSYSVTFNNNTVVNHNGDIINHTALSDDKTVYLENNICTSTYTQSFLCTNSNVVADSNIMVSDVSSMIRCTATTYTGLIATISNNYLVSKSGTNPFIYIGTEYSTTIDGYLSGSEVYNNRFSGPADWGNSPGAMHGLFSWSQQVNYHHNYLSGSFLGFVLKSNGGTYANAIYSNIIKDCNMSFTIKGIKGALIYNNTCYESAGYDGLAETNPGTTGNSGNSTIKNNIFYDTTTDLGFIYFEATSDSAGCIINNNTYYNAALAKIGTIGASNYTLAQWQALGFDAASLDTNPNFVSVTQLWPTAPFSGTNLGATYDDGLDITTNWGTTTKVPTVILNQQAGTWQTGAFVQ